MKLDNETFFLFKIYSLFFFVLEFRIFSKKKSIWRSECYLFSFIKVEQVIAPHFTKIDGGNIDIGLNMRNMEIQIIRKPWKFFTYVNSEEARAVIALLRSATTDCRLSQREMFPFLRTSHDDLQPKPYWDPSFMVKNINTA